MYKNCNLFKPCCTLWPLKDSSLRKVAFSAYSKCLRIWARVSIYHSWASASKKLAPASVVSVRYRTKQMPNCLCVVRYWTCPGTVSFFIPVLDWLDAGQSGILAFIHTHTNTHSPTHTYLWWTGQNMDRNMDVQHGHESMDKGMHHRHGDGQAPWMSECRNAEKKFSPASLVFR